ncbi:MAG TPA: acyltransferase [Acidobacteriaceae bacterium]
MNTESAGLTIASKPSGRIEPLDGWRAVAAGTVVVGHFFGHAHPRIANSVPGLFDFLTFAGRLGLQALFVISGYIICRLLLIEEQRYGSFSFRGFYVRRFVRVLPPFYLYLATIAVLAHFGLLLVTGRELASAALLIVDFHAGPIGWPTLHVWSLSVEEQFYLIFPTTLWLTPQRWRSRVFAAICVVVIAAALAAACNSHIYLPRRDGVMPGFVGIFWGVLLSLQEDRARRFARRVSPKIVLLLAVLLLFLSVACMEGWPNMAYQTLALPPAVGLLLFFTVEQKSWFSSFLRWTPLRMIGITSYSLYIWQQLFTIRAIDYQGAGRYIPRMLPLLFLIVPFSWVVIEKPSMALGKMLSRRWRKAPLASSATLAVEPAASPIMQMAADAPASPLPIPEAVPVPEYVPVTTSSR